MKELDNMRMLQDDWVPGALAISEKAIDFAEMLVNDCSKNELKDWEFAPYVNGTILMSYGDGVDGHGSCISIGEDSVTSFVSVGKNYKAYERTYIHNADEIINFFRDVNKQLRDWIGAEIKEKALEEERKSLIDKVAETDFKVDLKKESEVRKQIKKKKSVAKKNRKANRKNRVK